MIAIVIHAASAAYYDYKRNLIKIIILFGCRLFQSFHLRSSNETLTNRRPVSEPCNVRRALVHADRQMN
jgi:hypothetical protein